MFVELDTGVGRRRNHRAALGYLKRRGENSVPFKGGQYRGIFQTDDVALLQVAYDRCCELVGECPTTDEEKERLARLVIRVFQSSHHDPELTANNAAELARLMKWHSPKPDRP